MSLRSCTATAAALGFAAIGLVGCAPSPDEKFAQEVMAGVRHSLKDPESARFEGLQVYSEARVACGKVNAKNSMGGYVGNEEFSYYLERPYLESTDIEAKIEGTKRCLLAEAQRAVIELKSSNYPNKDELIKGREEQIEDLKISIGTSSSD